MKSMLFHRLVLSTDRNEVLKLAQEGQIIERPEDVLKDPYVFEFTGLPQLPVYKEGDLEEALVNNLSMFFLELGKGFTYVGRQQKMVIGGRTYAVDLVFYHRILKCFVLIDLKSGEVQHEDISGKTVLVIAHRMRTVSGADKIVVLKDGKVSEEGRPEELLKDENSLFRHMAQLQSINASWSV